MHPEGWKPFVDRLKSPWNAVLLAIAIALVVDYVLGSPMMSKLVSLQLKVMGLDPAARTMRLYTVFGVFTSAAVWTRFLERALMIIFFAIPGLWYLGGLWTAVRGR